MMKFLAYNGHQILGELASVGIGIPLTDSPTARCFLTTSKDMTAKLYIVEHIQGYKAKTFAGHKDYVMAAYFSKDQNTIYTIGRDGAVYTWNAKAKDEDSDAEEDDVEMTPQEPLPSTSSLDHPVNKVVNRRWGVTKKDFCNQPNSKVVSVTYHSPSSLLIVGFSNGVFGLWEMPSFNPVHTLSISQEKITSVAVNASGEWLAFGASKLGQLLVWEWQSESYILKQQGHYFDMNTLAFSPDDGGQYIVTGGDDGKVKLWNASSGFCFVTFDQHTSSISAVEFAKQGQVVFSASLDGTVRAFDMVRYRNFRTFVSPEPVQFNSLAVDPSGEIVAAAGSAASSGNFEIYIWSTQTGKLIETLPGHEGPISSLSFSPSGDRLASSSWDGSAKTWELYGRKGGASESFNVGSDALSLAWRPDGKEMAVTNLSGQILFFDPKEGRQVGLIEGRRDVGGGRKQDDRRTAANSESGKSFTSIAYTADGSCVLAGGNSKHVCLYDVRESVLLRKWTISENLALDGTQEFLDSRKITADGVALELVDDTGDASDLEDRLDANLPGAIKGDMSKRKYRPEVRTKCIRFSPAGRSWAAASTEGLLVYSLDSDVASFDPFDLDIEVTPESIDQAIDDSEHLKALVMAFRLNEQYVIRQVYESISPFDVARISAQLPEVYAEPLIRFIAGELEKGSRHVEFNLMWIDGLVAAHGRSLREKAAEVAATLRSLQKALQDCQVHIVKM